MSEKVWIEDVTGRDGLENQPNPVSTAQKLSLIRKIAAAGLSPSRPPASSTRAGSRSWPTPRTCPAPV